MWVVINVSSGSAYAHLNNKRFLVNPENFFVIKGTVIVPIKGVDNQFPDNHADFSINELKFIPYTVFENNHSNWCLTSTGNIRKVVPVIEDETSGITTEFKQYFLYKSDDFNKKSVDKNSFVKIKSSKLTFLSPVF